MGHKVVRLGNAYVRAVLKVGIYVLLTRQDSVQVSAFNCFKSALIFGQLVANGALSSDTAVPKLQHSASGQTGKHSGLQLRKSSDALNDTRSAALSQMATALAGVLCI